MNNKNILIDFEYLKSIDVNPSDALLLFECFKVGFQVPPVKLKWLEDRKLLKLSKDDVTVRHLGNEIIDKLSIDAEIVREEVKVHVHKSTRSIEEIVSSRVKEFRAVWSGLKPGSMGDPKACKVKLIKWMKENPEYDFDEILDASRAYIGSLDSYNYLQRADYFVYKQESNKTNVSRLSSFIGEKGEDTDTGDWTTNLI